MDNWFVILVQIDGFPGESYGKPIETIEIFGPYSQTDAEMVEIKLRTTVKPDKYYSYHTFIRPSDHRKIENILQDFTVTC